MEAGEGEEVRLVVDELVPSSSMCMCRICHEEEESSSTGMESPCSCAGSLKFAHRACIQRWCDEKESTICEICLQNFEPGYTVPTKKALIEMPVTIRDSLEVPRLNYELGNPEMMTAADDEGLGYAVCSPDSESRASCCRSVALTFTILLLLRHLIAVLSVGADQYAFTLLTVFVLRASGILLPAYFMVRLIKAIQHGQQLRETEESSIQVEEEDDELQDHIIQIPA